MNAPTLSPDLPPLDGCPFCNSTMHTKAGMNCWYAHCSSCQAEGPTRETEAEAIAAVNRRASRAGAAVPPDLHQQIVNLHFRRPAGLSTDPDNFRWMESGFKQARAQIVELVNAALSAATGSPAGKDAQHTTAVPADRVAVQRALDGIGYFLMVKDERRFIEGARNELLAALSAATGPTLTGWQPIETAPKDGRTLLLGHFNRHGKWRTLRGKWCSADTIAETWEEDAPEGWYETSVENDDTPNCWWTEPTHWTPLPPPPVSAAMSASTTQTQEPSND